MNNHTFAVHIKYASYSHNIHTSFDSLIMAAPLYYSQAAGAISVSGGKTVVNKCIFLDNVAATTATAATAASLGGAVRVVRGDLQVSNSIFKRNKALQVNLSARDGVGGGGAISVEDDSSPRNELLVLSSIFELNEASNVGGAAAFNAKGSGSLKVNWINNNQLLVGNDAGKCYGVFNSVSDTCKFVEENFSIEVHSN